MLRAAVARAVFRQPRARMLFRNPQLIKSTRRWNSSLSDQLESNMKFLLFPTAFISGSTAFIIYEAHDQSTKIRLKLIDLEAKIDRLADLHKDTDNVVEKNRLKNIQSGVTALREEIKKLPHRK